MSFIEDVFKGSLGTSLAIGVGTLIIAPVLVPVVVGIVKPVAKAAIKGGILLYEAGSKDYPEAGESLGDLWPKRSRARSRVLESRRRTPATPSGLLLRGVS